MTAGLLICDYMLPKWQAEFGAYPDMFTQLFPEFNWRFYEIQKDQFPETLEECDVYFATGSRHSVYDDLPWIPLLKAFIRKLYEQERYFIGVCFGHQIMGAALGGTVKKAEQGWCVGVHSFELKANKRWMEPYQDPIHLLMMCQDQIVALPPDGEVLASSPLCPVGMIQVGTTMLGIQAHPEFSKAYDQQLMEARRSVMGDAVVDAGMLSLQLEVHDQTFKNWVLTFLSDK